MWAIGDAYETYVGRWSRLVASDFVRWLGVPPSHRWLDVGCGTGALTEAILAGANPARVVGVDPSDGFLAEARRRVVDPRVELHTGDAQRLPVSDGSQDAVVSGLSLNFVPDPGAALAESVRVAAQGGVVAGYVWDYDGGMAMIRQFWDAAKLLNPAAAELDEARRFPLCRPEPLHALWTEAGLGDVVVEPIDVPSRFGSFDDYWTPFLGGQGPAPTYVASLTDRQRRSLRELLATRLPKDADGSITLTARAWAVRGTVSP
ncbi:class I SAM-dependent methyltransferase [Micromonospora sp. CPCC 205371]|nr:class I SAM-dependent methyltransferase [Micromonospora sp. CPCC 205371]